MKFEIPPEMIATIVNQILKEDLQMIEEDIKRLKELRDTGRLGKHQEIDLVNDKKYRKAMKVLLGYYGVADVY